MQARCGRGAGSVQAGCGRGAGRVPAGCRRGAGGVQARGHTSAFSRLSRCRLSSSSEICSSCDTQRSVACRHARPTALETCAGLLPPPPYPSNIHSPPPATRPPASAPRHPALCPHARPVPPSPAHLSALLLESPDHARAGCRRRVRCRHRLHRQSHRRLVPSSRDLALEVGDPRDGSCRLIPRHLGSTRARLRLGDTRLGTEGCSLSTQGLSVRRYTGPHVYARCLGNTPLKGLNRQTVRRARATPPNDDTPLTSRLSTSSMARARSCLARLSAALASSTHLRETVLTNCAYGIRRPSLSVNLVSTCGGCASAATAGDTAWDKWRWGRRRR